MKDFAVFITGTVGISFRNRREETRRERFVNRCSKPVEGSDQDKRVTTSVSDEQVATAHFVDLERGFATTSIPPGDRNDRPRVATHDRLEPQLDGEIEMRRQKWPGSLPAPSDDKPLKRG